MMKTPALFAMAACLLTAMYMPRTSQTDREQQLIGSWKWITVLDVESGKDMGLDMVTMGMAQEVKTEFRLDHTYTESKLKKGSNEYAQINGEWKLENNETLSLKAKDKWKPARIVQFSQDSLKLQMNPQMCLLMVREK